MKIKKGLLLLSLFILLLSVVMSCFNPLGGSKDTFVTVRLGGNDRAVCFLEDNYTEDQIDYTVTFTNIATNAVKDAVVTNWDIPSGNLFIGSPLPTLRNMPGPAQNPTLPEVP